MFIRVKGVFEGRLFILSTGVPCVISFCVLQAVVLSTTSSIMVIFFMLVFIFCVIKFSIIAGTAYSSVSTIRYYSTVIINYWTYAKPRTYLNSSSPPDPAPGAQYPKPQPPLGAVYAIKTLKVTPLATIDPLHMQSSAL